MADDGIQHGIDDNPTGDAEKGAALGGAGGAVTGAVAGSAAGPVGTVVGAVIGGIAGAVGSGAAVAAVDRVDNDDTITGVGGGVTPDRGNVVSSAVGSTADTVSDTAHTPVVDNGVPGVQTGGTAYDGTADTRGISEKTADAVTGDRIDDKTGKPVR